MAEAVFPSVAGPRGHYESFYLRAVDPHEPRGIWLRHTVHQPPGEPPTCALWCVLFERGAAPRALKQTLSAEALAHGDGDWIRVGLAAIGPGHAHGQAQDLGGAVPLGGGEAVPPTGGDPAPIGGGRSAKWELRFTGAEAPLRHLPAERLYRAPVPRTKTESPCPEIAVEGRFEIDGRAVSIDGWRGMVGHNWGAEHAERWLWLNGLAFDGAPGAWFDVAVGRVRLGPVTTPWIANGAVAIDGVRHRLGGLGRARSTRVAERPDGCTFVLRGERGIRVEGRLAPRPEERVAWRYADPEGGEHHAVNSSIAAIELTVRDPSGATRTLSSDHGGVFELGMRETDHGVPVQPYSDGA